MSFRQRAENFAGAVVGGIFFFRFLAADVLKVVVDEYPDFTFEVRAAHASGSPSPLLNVRLQDALGSSSYLFINSEEHVDFPQPISHKVGQCSGTQ